MSFDNVHKSINEMVSNISDPNSRFGFSIGDMAFHVISGSRPGLDSEARCVVCGFSDKQIEVQFPNGYKKFCLPGKVRKA